MTLFSFLAIVIVGADIGVTALLLFGLWRALRAVGKSAQDAFQPVLILGPILFGWLALALFLGSLGIFSAALNQPFPYIALAIGLPIVIGVLLIWKSQPIREIIDAVPQHWLIGLQFYRVLGVIFLVVYAAGQLPAVFALPAGYGDVLVGITALLIGTARLRGRSTPDRFITLWNWLGIADLIVALATGFLSSPTKFQIFSLDAPNYAIGSFPLVMIPIYAVPLSIVLHVASLTKLSRSRQVATPPISAQAA